MGPKSTVSKPPVKPHQQKGVLLAAGRDPPAQDIVMLCRSMAPLDTADTPLLKDPNIRWQQRDQVLAGPNTPGREAAAEKLQKRHAGYQGPGLCQGQESSWRGKETQGSFLWRCF